LCGKRWNAKTDCDCSTCFLTPEQAELNVLPSGPQRHTLVYGNARSGKAVLFVRAIAQRALHAPGSRTRCFGCAPRRLARPWLPSHKIFRPQNCGAAAPHIARDCFRLQNYSAVSRRSARPDRMLTIARLSRFYNRLYL